MNSPTFKAVIFDLDGTLVDTERYYRSAFFAAAQQFRLPVSAELYANLVGVATPERKDLLRRAFGPDVPIDDFIETYYAQRAVHLPARIPLCPGALDLLQQLRVPKAIATSASRRSAFDHVERAGLKGYFRHIVTRDDVHRGKPAPDTYIMAARHLSVAPSECLAIEDSPHGVTSAVAAGMQAVMVAPRNDPATGAMCLAVVSDLGAVRELIDTGSGRNHGQGSYVGSGGSTGQRSLTDSK